MVSTILSFVFIFLAAVCNAVMDTLEHHYSTSIFRSSNENFWNPKVSWNKGVNFFGSWGGPRWMTMDAWHISKTLMLIFFVLAIATYTAAPQFLLLSPIVWFIGFEMFYSLLLKAE